MLHRRFPPNQGLWNGVGGHIEPGETPREAVIREVFEETGFQVDTPRFAGLLTWEGFEIPPGGIYIFTVEVENRHFITNHEGELAWKPRDWACTSPQVVDNIHVFLPKILQDRTALHYHFTYHEGVRIKDLIRALPEELDLEKPYLPEEPMPEETRGEYLLSLDKERLQIDVIEDFLARRSYWGKGRSRADILRTIQNSVCFGIYLRGVQVAFARLVTDHVTFAWLCDVYVDDAQQGKGLGKWLVEAVCSFMDEQGIRHSLLATRDAQGLYQDYGGFVPLESPSKYLNRFHPDPERQPGHRKRD